MREYDFSGLVCPLPQMKATDIISKLGQGETVRIILGDRASLTGIAQELKSRGIKPDFQQEGKAKFILTITGSSS